MDLRPLAALSLILLSTGLLTFVHALPVDDVKRAAVELPDPNHDDGDKHNDVDQYGDYDSNPEVEHPIDFEKISPSSETGCTVPVTTTYNVTKEEIVDYETGQTKIILVEVNKTTYECCAGHEGPNCDKVDSPCGNLTCLANPNAQCALIKRCGIEIPLFVDDMGRVIKDCLHEEHLCMGICKTDPCKGLTCERYSDAMCFTSGCSCEPVWLLPTKVRVSDCSLEERQVRQADNQCP